MTLEASPLTPQRAGLRLAAVGSDQFRVVDTRDRIVGHIQLVPDEQGVRYRAKRYNPLRGAFAEFGEFWRLDDALSCLPLR